jgi:hypothetical protein
MAHDSSDPWAALPEDEALRLVQHSIAPGWEAWTVLTTDEGIVWCARRLADGAVAHGDHPSRLLEHIAEADEKALQEQRGWS